VVRLPDAKKTTMTIVRNNKSQAYLQVKVKEDFPYAFRSAVIGGKRHRAEGIGHGELRISDCGI
jgi:hypothetical protein